MKRLNYTIIRKFILVTISIFLLNACSQNGDMPVKSENNYHFNDENTISKSDFRSMVNSDPDLSDMVFFPEKHTLKEFDAYYRKHISGNDMQRDNQDVKNIFFSIMDQNYDLSKNADKSTLIYYLNEMDKISFLNTSATQCYAKVVQVLQDKYGLSSAKLDEHVKIRLEKNIEHIKKNYTKNLAVREELLKGQNVLTRFQ